MSEHLPGHGYTLKYDSLPLSKRFDVLGTQNLKRSMKPLGSGVNFNNGIDFIDPQTGFTPLIVAAVQGKVLVVRALIDRGADLEFQEQDKLRTALIMAANHGKADCVEEILRRGALIDAIDKYEMTALMHAAKHGHKDCIAILLSRGASPNHTDDHGFTAAHLAAKFGYFQIIEQLFEKGASLEIRDLVEGKTPLHLAAQYGRKDTVSCLLDREAKINRRSSFDKTTAIMLASKEGHKSTVSLLIARGADANLVDLYGWAPLHFAASWGRKDTSLILIVEGNADVNSCETTAKGEGGTPPIIVAAKGSHKEIVKLLLQYGADVNLPELHHGHTALSAAAELGLPEVVQLLLDFGANINRKNHLTGMTALLCAARAGRRGAIVTLLNNLADMNILDNRSYNALMHAEKAGFRDVLLSAIVHLTPYAKVNLIPWVEMELPHMVRGSLGGSSAVFMNSSLYTHYGMYNGLLKLPSDCDVYLIYCLVMLAAGIKRSMYNDKYDTPTLTTQLAQIDNMLIKCVTARSMSIDCVFSDAFTLGYRPIATLGEYDIKYFATAFMNGPLALYIENNLTAMISTPEMREKIDRSFWCCLRDNTKSIGDYGNRTSLLKARYVPAIMLLLEMCGKLVLLVCIVYHSTVASESSVFLSSGPPISTFFSTSEIIVCILTISTVLYECGQMEEKRWAVSPSIVFSINELEYRRKLAMCMHFVQDPYKFMDFCTCAGCVIWLITAAYTRGSSSQSLLSAVGERFLVFATIPLCVGLLRYPAAFDAHFGTQVLTIFMIIQSYFHFLVIYIVTGVGFGVVLYGIFRTEIYEFDTPARSLQTLFNAILKNYDTTVFDASPNYAIGIATAIVFLLWSVFVLFNALIAHASSNYAKLSSQADQYNVLIKCKMIQQYSTVYEKSPLCMLPPPLNLVSSSFYAFHVYYAWRAKLYSKRMYCISLGGVVSDYTLGLTLLPLTTLYEYIARILYADIGEANKFFLILLAPFGLVYCMMCLVYKLFAAPYTVLIVKSRISDGRLRVSYGYRRDNIENSSLARFEDERMSKFLSTFKHRHFTVNDESVTTDGVESYRNITGGSENDDYRSDEKSEFEYTDDDVSKVTFNSTVNGNDNASLMTRIKTKFKPREPNYAGRKVRVVPTSPFLQLSRVHELEEVQRVLPRTPAPPLYRQSLVPLPLAIQQQMQQQKLLDGSLSNKPDHHHAAQVAVTRSNFPEINEERSPVLLLDNGTISPYQPGLVSQPQLDHFTTSVDVDYQDAGYVPPDSEGVYKNNTGVAMVPTDEDLYPMAPMDAYQEALHTTAAYQSNAAQYAVQYHPDTPQNERHQNTITQPATHRAILRRTGPTGVTAAAAGPTENTPAENAAMEEELQLLEHPSIYFTRHKFPPIFLEHERKSIFEVVLPEMFLTDFAATVKDTESYLISTQDRMKILEKQVQLQTGMIQHLLQMQSNK